jgi:hypothetical protein
VLFQGKTKDVKTKKKFTSLKDSVGYSNAAKYDSEQFNLKKAYKKCSSFSLLKARSNHLLITIKANNCGWLFALNKNLKKCGK